MITQSQLKDVLSYDQETGIFTWKVSPERKTKVGSVAGSYTEKGYIRIRFQRKNYYAHRLAWLYVHGAFPEIQLDHINRIRDDNRIENLRSVSNQENANNKSIRVDSFSKEKCIFFIKKERRYLVEVKRNKKRHYVGYFYQLCDAVVARDNFLKALEKA